MACAPTRCRGLLAQSGPLVGVRYLLVAGECARRSLEFERLLACANHGGGFPPGSGLGPYGYLGGRLVRAVGSLRAFSWAIVRRDVVSALAWVRGRYTSYGRRLQDRLCTWPRRVSCGLRDDYLPLAWALCFVGCRVWLFPLGIWGFRYDDGSIGGGVVRLRRSTDHRAERGSIASDPMAYPVPRVLPFMALAAILGPAFWVRDMKRGKESDPRPGRTG